MSVPLLESCWIPRVVAHPKTHNLLLVDPADYEENPVRHVGWLGQVWLLQVCDHVRLQGKVSPGKAFSSFPASCCSPSCAAWSCWHLIHVYWHKYWKGMRCVRSFQNIKRKLVFISYSNINGLALKASDNFQSTKPKFSPRKSKLLMLRCWNVHIQEALPNKGMATWKESQVFLNSET